MPAEQPKPEASASAFCASDAASHDRSHSPMQLTEFRNGERLDASVASDAVTALRVEFGRLRPTKRIDCGAVIPLDPDHAQFVEVFSGDELVARGTLVAADGRVGVRLVEMVHTVRREEAA